MTMLDWLFGGRWGFKTALLSGLLGMGVYFATGGSLEGSAPNHWYLIALGYPILLIGRTLYWTRRRRGLEQRILWAEGRERGELLRELQALAEFNARLAVELEERARGIWSLAGKTSRRWPQDSRQSTNSSEAIKPRRLLS